MQEERTYDFRMLQVEKKKNSSQRSDKGKRQEDTTNPSVTEKIEEYIIFVADDGKPSDKDK